MQNQYTLAFLIAKTRCPASLYLQDIPNVHAEGQRCLIDFRGIGIKHNNEITTLKEISILMFQEGA